MTDKSKKTKPAHTAPAPESKKAPAKAPRADAVDRKAEKLAQAAEPAAKKPAKAKAKAKPKKRAPRAPDKKVLAAKQKEAGEKNKGGRPTKLTPLIQEEVCKALKAGMYMETAAAYAGIDKDTLYDWLKKGARGESPEHAKFSDAVKRAVAEAELTDLLMIKKAASEGTWQAAAWRLERRFRERWGRSISVNKDTLKDLSDEELLALLEDANTPGN